MRFGGGGGKGRGVPRTSATELFTKVLAEDQVYLYGVGSAMSRSLRRDAAAVEVNARERMLQTATWSVVFMQAVVARKGFNPHGVSA